MNLIKFKSVFPFCILILSILITSGCDKDDAPNQPQVNKPVIAVFTVNPSSVPAAGDTVTLSWKVSDAASLTISPGVGTVTPVDSGSVKVFVSAATTFTLTAINSAGTSTSAANVEAAQALTVNGFVKDLDGVPIGGVSVIIKGKSPVITSANGAFTIPNVVTPYDLSVILSQSKTAITYKGLSRPDPTILYFGSITSSKSASISGLVPQPAFNEKTIVFFVSGEKAWANSPIGMNYSFSAEWRGSEASFTGKLYLLRWTEVNGLPSDYTAFASKELTISNGGNFNNIDFTQNDVSNPAEQNISGSVIRPSLNYIIWSKALHLNIGDANVMIANHSGTTENFSYMVPTISGSTFSVSAIAGTGVHTTQYYKKGITAGSSGVTLNLYESPKLNLPANNGTGVDTTTQFLWANGGGTGVYYIRIMPVGNGPQFYIFCSENNCHIPNFSPQGMECPSNTSYQWMVSHYFPFSSIDEAASEMFSRKINGYSGDYGQANSESFTFKTR